MKTHLPVVGTVSLPVTMTRRNTSRALAAQFPTHSISELPMKLLRLMIVGGAIAIWLGLAARADALSHRR
jgi:hypothetical protein